MTRGEAKGKEGAGHANKENTEEIENDLKVCKFYISRGLPVVLMAIFIYGRILRKNKLTA